MLYGIAWQYMLAGLGFVVFVIAMFNRASAHSEIKRICGFHKRNVRQLPENQARIKLAKQRLRFHGWVAFISAVVTLAGVAGLIM